MNLNSLISLADVSISFVFTVLVLRQALKRRKMHQVLWSVALGLWTLAVSAELFATVTGWSSLTYRLYYSSGALLIPAWLGMGTLYLVTPKRWSEIIFKLLSIASIVGIGLILTWQIDPALLTSSEQQFIPLRVFPFFPVQLLLIVLNTFGSIAFIGGALWSAIHFARQRTQGQRALSTLLIALGGSIAAVAHSLGALGGIELFRVSELAAVMFIFAGFVLGTPPAVQTTPSIPSTRTWQT